MHLKITIAFHLEMLYSLFIRVVPLEQSCRELARLRTSHCYIAIRSLHLSSSLSFILVWNLISLAPELGSECLGGSLVVLLENTPYSGELLPNAWFVSMQYTKEPATVLFGHYTQPHMCYNWSPLIEELMWISTRPPVLYSVMMSL